MTDWTALAGLESRGLAADGRVNDAGLARRTRIEVRTDQLTERTWKLLGEELTTTLLDLLEPVGERLLARIDVTAGPDWMPAGRNRRTV